MAEDSYVRPFVARVVFAAIAHRPEVHHEHEEPN